MITANSQIKRLLRCTGANSKVSINVDGNDNIGYAISMQCVNPIVEGCNIKDLNGFTNWGGVGVKFELDGLNTYVVCKNNTFDNLYAVGDGVGANGAGMSRAVIAWRQPLSDAGAPHSGNQYHRKNQYTAYLQHPNPRQSLPAPR